MSTTSTTDSPSLSSASATSSKKVSTWLPISAVSTLHEQLMDSNLISRSSAQVWQWPFPSLCFLGNAAQGSIQPSTQVHLLREYPGRQYRRLQGPMLPPNQRHHARLKNNPSQSSPRLASVNSYQRYPKPILAPPYWRSKLLGLLHV